VEFVWFAAVKFVVVVVVVTVGNVEFACTGLVLFVILEVVLLVLFIKSGS